MKLAASTKILVSVWCEQPKLVMEFVFHMEYIDHKSVVDGVESYLNTSNPKENDPSFETWFHRVIYYT